MYSPWHLTGSQVDEGVPPEEVVRQNRTKKEGSSDPGSGIQKVKRRLKSEVQIEPKKRVSDTSTPIYKINLLITTSRNSPLMQHHQTLPTDQQHNRNPLQLTCKVTMMM